MNISLIPGNLPIKYCCGQSTFKFSSEFAENAEKQIFLSTLCDHCVLNGYFCQQFSTGELSNSNKGESKMRSGKNLLGLALMFFVFAVVFSIIFWADVSLAAKIGMFALGFGTGVTFGGWFYRRDA